VLSVFFIGITHKDLWIHTSVCWIFLWEMKESIQLKGKIKNDARLGGRVEPAEVGVLHHKICHLCPLCHPQANINPKPTK
jgi:hypothetical protein